MIRRYIRNLIICVAVLGGGWFLWHRTEIETFGDAITLLKKDGNNLISTLMNASFSSRKETRNSITVASFDLTDFDDQKLNDAQTAKILVQVLSKFDVIAIQGIQSADHDTLPRLMDYLRQVSADYDYIIGPRSSHTAVHHQFAFIYNQQTIELEREQVYSIQDPDDVIAHDPLVGWFRSKGPTAEESFTFSLVNLRIDPTNREAELVFLQKIKMAVKNDGHNEDDVILIGTFHQNSISLLNQKCLPGSDFVITQDPTDLLGERQSSNIAFPVQASSEFTGRAGVFDFLTEFNLSVSEAERVSLQLPIWAEFFTREGAAAGYVASISR